MSDPLLLEHLACRATSAARRRAQADTARRLAALTEQDRQTVDRARRLERFLTQPFHVAKPFTRWEGRDVPRDEAVAGCRRILDGELDHVPEGCFLYVGGVDEVLERAARGEEGRPL